MSDEYTLIVPTQLGCQDRYHPIKKDPDAGTYCLICTLIWRIGGDRAVEQSRNSEAMENRWLMGLEK